MASQLHGNGASSWVLGGQRLQAGQYMAPIHVYMDDHPDLNHPIH